MEFPLAKEVERAFVASVLDTRAHQILEGTTKLCG